MILRRGLYVHAATGGHALEIQTTGLRARREALGLSRERLARQVGNGECSASTIALVERGWRCSDEMADKIAAAVGLVAAELWTGGAQ
jgi:predicted transcriptional regulator